eukprot:CAMPEP_0173432662 /NCGR_PEP_ID=MMETSP1357-20121228/10379_1 /TAXON_ID=77926 /ORGANISM="Hemiselmis rufescens, Strain PCC563" /LENGTH=901 /DNA_ID=CAMNT_0014397289 /DNA_START=64 /DNA_END=2769 /DNA_ORIENTATION=+
MDAAALRLALANAQNPDANTRNAAEEQLKASCSADAANHLFLLSNELQDESAPNVQTRSLAGLTLKNFMTSKDHAQAVKLANDWMALNPEVRSKIKSNSCQALSSLQRDVQLAAAQVISKIATIELPKTGPDGRSQWEELMPLLLQSVVQPEPTPQGLAKKQASLHTIGYICEEIASLETDCLASKSNEILTAVVAGMRNEEQDLAVKLAATKALSNALEFANKNFEVDQERNYIMQVICEACTCNNEEIQEHAYQCLCRIAELYYDKLIPYIQKLLELTIMAITTQKDNVARQAIAFWSAVCDTEFEMINSDEEAECKKFIMGATPYLVPDLLKTMRCQEEGQDEDSYNKSTEAAACLAAIASTICDEVLAHVVPWVQQNISSQDWHAKEAAVMAFGCIMDGPSPEELKSYVGGIMDTLIAYLVDPEDLVKNSSAWAIMRITEFAPESIGLHIAPLCDKLMQVMPQSEPQTANHLCWAVHHAANFVRASHESHILPKNQLSPILPKLVECLVTQADRGDATEANLRANAYEALNVVVSTADDEAIRTFIAPTLLPMFGERLNATFGMPCLNADDLNTRNEWQSFFCGALQTCINLMPPEHLVALDPASGMNTADKFMHLFLQVFSSQNTTAAQEALLAVGSVCNVLPQAAFDRYMPTFSGMLVALIATSSEPGLCMLALTTTSDVARTLEGEMVKYSDQIVEVILSVLARPEVDAQVAQVHDFIKPAAYSCIGDIAMAIGAGMEKYLQYWLAALQQGCETAKRLKEELSAKDGYDEDKRNYLNALVEGIFDGYVGVVQGLKAASASTVGATDAFLQPIAVQGGCLMLVEVIASDEDKTESVLRTAVGLLGDLAETYGEKIKPMLSAKPCIDLVMQAKAQGMEADTNELGHWAGTRLGIPP